MRNNAERLKKGCSAFLAMLQYLQHAARTVKETDDTEIQDGKALKDERAEQIYPQDCFACRKIEEYPGKKAGFIASLLGLNIQDIKVCI